MPERARSVLGLLRTDRLARWSAIGSVPVVWLAVALVSPLLLLLAPLLALGLWVSFAFGPFERRIDHDWSDA